MAITGEILCRFMFECEKRWDELEAVPNRTDIKFCSSCSSKVFLCRNYGTLVGHVAQDHCVAFGEQEDGPLRVGQFGTAGIYRRSQMEQDDE